MKILIDINHPAHVHYFRNLIKIMESEGHAFKVVNRDSPMINYLLDYYRIAHTIRNPRPKRKGTVASLCNLGKMVLACIRESMDFKPDMYLGFASSACAITSAIFGKPCILLDDTEHNAMNHKIYLKFCSCVLTPFYFKKALGNKQLFFNAFVEQLYLHSSVYNPTTEVLKTIGVKPDEYILIRYISYDAHHDLAAQPLPENYKRKIVDELSKKYRVLVSHESSPNPYKEFALDIHPEQMHDVEANAKFMITEGATMASESFVLGVPSLYINPLRVGYTDIQAATFPETVINSTAEREIEDAIRKIEKKDAKEKASVIRKRLEISTINPTDFLIWFVENYPESEHIMRTDPDYQNRFRTVEPADIEQDVLGGNTLEINVLVFYIKNLPASCAA